MKERRILFIMYKNMNSHTLKKPTFINNRVCPPMQTDPITNVSL